MSPETMFWIVGLFQIANSVAMILAVFYLMKWARRLRDKAEGRGDGK